jgi:hypothetical protein
MWLQTVKFIVKKSKCAGLAQEIGFSAPDSCSLPWLVKGATEFCTSEKECNKLDLSAAQYFWLVDHNDWSRWFAISSSHVFAVPVTVLFGWVAPKKTNTAQLRHLILLSRVTYWAIRLWKFTTYWVNPCWKCIILISNYTWDEYQYLLLSNDEYGKFWQLINIKVIYKLKKENNFNYRCQTHLLKTICLQA